MSRLLTSYNIPAPILAKLYNAHYNTVSDIQSIGIGELAAECDLTLDNVKYLYDLIQSHDNTQNTPNESHLSELSNLQNTLYTTQSALTLLHSQYNTNKLQSQCSAIDNLLNNGFSTRTIYELCGQPGIGKTQLLLQLCCTVQLPYGLGGLNGNALYIDTEGSFTSQRIDNIANHIIYKLKSTKSTTLRDTDQQYINTVSIKQYMQNIEYLRIHDYTTLLNCIHWLNSYLITHTSIKLICIDSIACLFRYGFSNNYTVRNRLLSQIAIELNKLVRERNIIIITTNHVTTQYNKYDSNSNNNVTTLKPALGDTWLACGCNVRIVMQYNNAKQRIALLHKSGTSSTNQQEVPYDITVDGIVDVEQQM